ncbi:polysaccharide lyase beta-sandwich domain-containing protein [Prolixibacteraceae bacterium Z1-6]|uniref:Polysaccharide lyase beta-sandwich domain-containing protein n=1 Tax=Draconibacterium aestuarii TaxID=2998507 RepID=A0A9X3J5X0_9BACT|nr:polysaccharide lyase beta-sandwich domain-containing protein [Prolixibacteraceae bacterium Z1-6]
MIQTKLALIILFFMAMACYGSAATNGQTNPDYPEELQQLHKNVLDYILDEPINIEDVIVLLDELQEDGSWVNIDYSSQQRGAWQPVEHLRNLLQIVRAYKIPGTEIYESKKASDKIHLVLNYWLENDFICPNWWYPVIGVPRELNPIMLLLEPEISKKQKEQALVILNRCKIGRTGQNKVWQSGNVLLTSMLVKDVPMIKKAGESIKEELTVSIGEGVQPDWSYHQHGPQLQFGNYGLSYVDDMIKWITILRKTPYHFDENSVTVLRNYLLEGLQWVTWKHQMDISACGRQLFIDSPEQKAATLSRQFRKMEKLDPDNSAEYLKANDYTSLTGQKYFWRSNFYVFRKPEYYFSVKMCSDRVIGAESCNSENIQGYYMGDGATYLYQTGEEYRNIFPFWDWKKVPGTTTQQDEEPLPVLTASGYRIESDFVGGMIGRPIGKYPAAGMATMKYRRNGLAANKAWFFVQDMIVCLGSGISSETGLPVTTSINQTFLNGEVEIQAEEIIESNGVKSLVNPKWILHDSVGYFFPNGGNLKLETKIVDGSWNRVAKRYPDKIAHTAVFKLYFDHGENPKSKDYQYIILPGATKEKLIELEKKFPFEIINEADKQEVVSAQGWNRSIVFYEPGESEAMGGIEVDKSCILMIDQVLGNMNVQISDPTINLDQVKLTLSKKLWINNRIVEEAGKSVINIKFLRTEYSDNSTEFTFTKNENSLF